MRKSIFSAEHQHLCSVLRTVREEAGLRQIDVAEQLKVPQSFVSKYENGERRLDLVELQQVCKAVGIELSELVRRFETKPRRRR